MTRSIRTIVPALAVCAVALLTGCVHVQPSTGLSYFLHTDYDVFYVDESPVRAVSNYIGYCLMPMKEQSDRATMVHDLVGLYLESNGYIRLSQAELLAEPKLIPQTFLVGVGYVESFLYESLQLQINLYYVDEASRKNRTFWSWKAKFDGYPIMRRTIEPALRDLFIRKPMDWGRTETMFPKRGATDHDVSVFYERLGAARLKSQQLPPGSDVPPLDTAP